MKPVDTTALDVRNLFDLIYYYDSNYDEKILRNYDVKNNALNLIKSILHFAWTDEAGILHPTELQINQFVIHGMQVNIKTTGLKPGTKVFEKDKATHVRKEKITVEISIDYPGETLSVVLVDYI